MSALLIRLARFSKSVARVRYEIMMLRMGCPSRHLICGVEDIERELEAHLEFAAKLNPGSNVSWRSNPATPLGVLRR